MYVREVRKLYDGMGGEHQVIIWHNLSNGVMSILVEEEDE